MCDKLKGVFFLKVCRKCKEVNEDGAPICKNSNCASSSFEDYKEVSNEANKELERKRVIKNKIALAILTIYTIVFLTGMVLNINRLGVIDIIVAGILTIGGIACLKFTGAIFMFRHMFSVKDVDESDMSDMYDTYIKLSGVIALGYSLFILF